MFFCKNIKSNTKTGSKNPGEFDAALSHSFSLQLRKIPMTQSQRIPVIFQKSFSGERAD